MRRGTLQAFNGRVIELAYNLPRRPHNKAIVGNLFPFCYQGIRTDQTIVADFGTIKNRGPHANQAVIANRAAMKHGLVANCTTFSDG